jgi:prenyltransferase beta subunit
MIKLTLVYFKLIAVLFCLSLLFSYDARAQPSWKNSTLNYLQTSLAKKDGGFGWEDQYDSHLTPTYAAIGIMYDLDKLPENKDKLIAFVKTHHPQRGKNKEAGPSGTEERDLVYQQMQSLLWLKGDIVPFKDEVVAWKPQNNKVSNFESHGYPVFLQEMMSPVCRGLLKVSMEDISTHYSGYLTSRRRDNGSYNNAPATDGGDGNILNTYWGLYASQQLNGKNETRQQTIDWINACMTKNGGYTHQPNPAIGAVTDIAYTWAAVKVLQLLSAEPAEKQACIRYIISLRNNDGGFGKDKGMPSDPMATFYAIDALKAMSAFAVLEATPFKGYSTKKQADFSGLKVFTVQFEASGTGSPAEAVMLADSLHINLWGTKNSTPSWRATAQKIADEKKVPVVFFQSDEAYGKTVTVDGQGTFSHIMDYIAPASANRKLDLDGSSWQTYTKTFIHPLMKDNGTLVLQVTNNEPLGRIILDESLRSGGFAAISTIHFGQNFLFWLPWLQQYRYQLPFVALQDAHGSESWWWVNELAGYRTLFLGKTGSYDDMITALKSNWMAAARHDSISDNKTRLLGGAEGVQAFMLKQQNKWKWWQKGSSETRQLWAAITVIDSTDTFEIARPLTGISVRIRPWWNSIRQALKEQMVTLESLKVDNIEVKTTYEERKDKKEGITDSYYLYEAPGLSNGKHVIEATLRNIKNNEVRRMTKIFTISNRHVF